MGQRNKILFLDHTPIVGGAQLSLIHHLEKLDKEKFEISIGCSKKAEELGLTDFYNDLGVKYYFLPIKNRLKISSPASFLSYAKSVISVYNLIRREKIDLLVTNTVRTALSGSLAAWLAGKKSVWFIRDFTFPLKIFKLFSIFPKKIIFNSIATEYYYKNHIISNGKSVVIYTGRNFFKTAAKIGKEEIFNQRKLWETDNNTIIVGYISRLTTGKGPQILIKALDYLIKKEGMNNLKCVIAGTGKNQSGDNEDEIKKIVKNLNLEKYFIFTGYQKDISVILMSLDMLISTSIEPESLPSTIVDAMMARIPVISSDVGGVREIVINNKTGLLVKPGDSAELGTAIKEIINNKSLRDSIVNGAYANVMQYHNVDINARQFEKIYLETL